MSDPVEVAEPGRDEGKNNCECRTGRPCESFSDCTAFVPGAALSPAISLATLVAGNYDFATGASPWSTTGTPGESKTYHLVWLFDTTGLTQLQIDALQGASVGVDFVWELQSN